MITTGAPVYVHPILWTQLQPHLLDCTFVHTIEKPRPVVPPTHRATLDAARELHSGLIYKDVKDGLFELLVNGCGMTQVM